MLANQEGEGREAAQLCPYMEVCLWSASSVGGPGKLGNLPMVQTPPTPPHPLQQALQPPPPAAVPPPGKSVGPRDRWDSSLCQPGKSHATPVLGVCGSAFPIRDARED